jgi:hypothetical protein
MKLQDALKTSLDELRMQMLGAQVLFGFQFQGLFQNNFRFGGRDDPRLQSIGSLLITTALLPLACAISCDVLIALTRLCGDTAASRSAALVVLFFLLGLWYVLPLLIKRTLRGAVDRG